MSGSGEDVTATEREYVLQQVTRDEWLELFRPSMCDRIHRRLVAARCRLLGHRWESQGYDHGPGLHEVMTWCRRCYIHA